MDVDPFGVRVGLVMSVVVEGGGRRLIYERGRNAF
jgi:hypothetical protein